MPKRITQSVYNYMLCAEIKACTVLLIDTQYYTQPLIYTQQQ